MGLAAEPWLPGAVECAPGEGRVPYRLSLSQPYSLAMADTI